MAHGVRTITLGGEQRVVDLNLHAMTTLLKELKCDLNELPAKMAEIGAEYPIRAMGYVVYAGLIGHKEAEAEFIHDITLKNVMKWMGEYTEGDYEGIWDWFKEVNQIPSASTEQIEKYAEVIKKKKTEAQPSEAINK